MNECKTYTVKDFMRDDVMRVKPHTKLSDVIKLMLEGRTNALVVVDDSDAVLGIVTSWALIEHLVPDYLEEDKHLAAFEADSVFCQRLDWMKDHLVEDIMSKNVHTVHPDDSLMQVSTQISQHHIRQLPVLDDNNKLVGYINHTDIKRAMGMALGFDNDLLK